MIELVKPGRFVALLLPDPGTEGPAAPVGTSDDEWNARSFLMDLLTGAPRGSCGRVWDSSRRATTCGVRSGLAIGG